MKRKTRILLVVLAIVCVAGIVFAQQRGFGGRRGYRRTPDLTQRNGVPEWDVDPAFKKDVFTFVRVRYTSTSRYGANGQWRTGGDWYTDAPDSDLNFSYRLQQLTSLKVDPKGKILELTDDELFDYPFIYIVEPGRLEFNDEERACLRRYLLNGGFLMVDDFWGIPASGRAWQFDGMAIYRIADGRIAEAWYSEDFLGWFQQLGVLPSVVDAVKALNARQ